jgi:hypothetical protein
MAPGYMNDMMAIATKLSGGACDEPGPQDEATLLMDLGLADMDFDMLDVGHPNRSSLPGQYLLPGMMPAGGGNTTAAPPAPAPGNGGIGPGLQQAGAVSAPVNIVTTQGASWAPAMHTSAGGAVNTAPPTPASHRPTQGLQQQQLGAELVNTAKYGQYSNNTSAPGHVMSTADMAGPYAIKQEPGYEWQPSAATMGDA